MRETILTFCAHNDDQIIGPGGTLAKYAKQGKKFKTYVYSYGESSHLYMKEHVVQNTRIQEAYDSDKIMGGSGIFFFGLKEGKFMEEFEKKNLAKKVKDIVKKEKTSKIFTHSIDDPHPDHQAVYKTIMKTLDDMNYKGDVYSFNVWNPINVRIRNSPKLVVDTSDTFKIKLKAFFVHKSQRLTIASLIWGIWFKDWKNGLKNKCKFAEVFYKIR